MIQQKEELAKMIGVFFDSWTGAQMTDATLAGAEPPAPADTARLRDPLWSGR